VTTEAIGGPLIDENGKAVGIVGGSFTPGIRVGERILTSTPWLFRLRTAGTAAIPIAGLPATLPSVARTFADLAKAGELTPAVDPVPELSLAGTTTEVPKDPANRIIQDRTEFSIREGKDVVVYTFWRKMAQRSRGDLTATLSSVTNQVVGDMPPKRVNLGGNAETRIVFGWQVAKLPVGYYRIDVMFDGTITWRTYVRVVD
jgi:hypothetical protein